MTPRDEDPGQAPAVLRLVATLAAPVTAECLEDGIVAALAEGAADAELRGRTLPHLARCTRCRQVVASVARALADDEVRKAIGSAEVEVGARWYRRALPIAAVAAVVLLVWLPHRADDARPPHRSLPVTVGEAPAPAAPIGVVAEIDELKWSSVAAADRYRVTLFDATGALRFEVQLSDTIAALPDSLVLAPGSSYLWKVEARIGWDRWVTSQVVEFTVAGSPRP